MSLKAELGSTFIIPKYKYIEVYVHMGYGGRWLNLCRGVDVDSILSLNKV